MGEGSHRTESQFKRHVQKDFLTRCCLYANIVVVGRKENIQRIIDALQEMQNVMKELAIQIQSGGFSLSKGGHQELREDYLALVVTIVDIVDGAAYLFDKEKPSNRKNWKAELELEQYRSILENKKESN